MRSVGEHLAEQTPVERRFLPVSLIVALFVTVAGLECDIPGTLGLGTVNAAQFLRPRFRARPVHRPATPVLILTRITVGSTLVAFRSVVLAHYRWLFLGSAGIGRKYGTLPNPYLNREYR